MPWEMLSGPDLGGGFLFQLTAEPVGDRVRLLYHAQEGGLDASGPPAGSPVPLGFVRTPTACEIGGRDCYHRAFELPADAVPRARLAYNRLRFVTTPMLEQQYRGAEIPVRAGLEEVVARLAPAFAERSDGWFVAGSAAAWLQGSVVVPHELDLGTDGPGVERIATALADYLIEPAAATTWRELGAVVGARAYVGTLRAGVRVQWARRSEDAAAGASDLGADPAEVTTARVVVGARAVRASRPEYALVRATLRGDRVGAAAVAGPLRSAGADLSLLDRLLAASALPPTERSRVRASVAPASSSA